MFSGICAALAEQAAKRCHGDFLKEKGQITRFPKDATPEKFFFDTKHIESLKRFYLDFYPKTKRRSDSRSQWLPKNGRCSCHDSNRQRIIYFMKELFKE